MGRGGLRAPRVCFQMCVFYYSGRDDRAIKNLSAVACRGRTRETGEGRREGGEALGDGGAGVRNRISIWETYRGLGFRGWEKLSMG